jgi:hypothetical protein
MLLLSLLSHWPCSTPVHVQQQVAPAPGAYTSSAFGGAGGLAAGARQACHTLCAAVGAWVEGASGAFDGRHHANSGAKVARRAKLAA